MLNRFKSDPERRLDVSVFDKLKGYKKKVFLCSTHDLYGPWIPEIWTDEIISLIDYYKNYTFQVLTRYPERIKDFDIPKNLWLGVSIDGEGGIKDYRRFFKLCDRRLEIPLKFVSMEPLLKPIGIHGNNIFDRIDWLIVGRLMYYGKKHDPSPGLLKKYVSAAERNKIPLFMKDNLKDIWPGELIQQFPEV
jgi:protein gp37